jgi:GAF domain-containing protein
LTKPPSAERGDTAPKVAEAFGQLRSLLAEANQLAEVLERIAPRANAAAAAVEAPPAATTSAGDAARIKELERRLEAAQDDQEQLTSQLVEAENLAGKLMSLYVATYQLHVSLDPVEVQNAIAEIAKDLLGASSFVLLIKDEVEGGCEIALATGISENSRFTGKHYEGGDRMVDATLDDGVLRMESEEDTESLAAVPLRVEDAIVGALVILKVVDHKVTPLSEDRDILDLLAAHAASALFAARVYNKTDRKLRTLQSLVNLIRGA